jgi:hypothetical protein
MKTNIQIEGSWEDEIFRVKEFVSELAKVQDQYFTELFNKLETEGLCERFGDSEKANDFLFDYVFNTTKEETFEEFLSRFKAKKPKIGYYISVTGEYVQASEGFGWCKDCGAKVGYCVCDE